MRRQSTMGCSITVPHQEYGCPTGRFLVAVCLLFVAAGCTSRDSLSIARMPIRSFTGSDANVPDSFDAMDTETRSSVLARDDHLCSKITSEALACVKTGSPYLVAHRVFELSDSLPDSVKSRILNPLVGECAESDEPAIRWCAIFIASDLGQHETARGLLEKDLHSLLNRPEPQPWWACSWWRYENSLFNRLNAALTIVALRTRMIKLVGEYQLLDARPILKAILADKNAWYDQNGMHSETTSVAAEALSAL